MTDEPRTPRNPNARTIEVRVLYSPEEYVLVKAAADAESLSMSSFQRRASVLEAKRQARETLSGLRVVEESED